jgi:hypothetical protein
MKFRIFVGIAAAALLICQPVYAGDICRLAGQALGKDAQEVDAFFQDRIQGVAVSGSAKVLEMSKDASDQVEGNYTLLLDCGNGVMISLQAGSFWVKNSGAREGGSLSFSGKCSRLQRVGDKSLRAIVIQQ